MGSATTHYLAPRLLRRIAAMVYDSLLLMAVSIFYGALVISIHVLINGAPTTGSRVDWGDWGILVCIGWLATIVFFFCFFWHNSGQTLGMKTWKIQIISEYSGFPTYKQCVLRCACAPISLLCLGIGYWWLYTNAERQTLHDKISHTRTILLLTNTKNG